MAARRPVPTAKKLMNTNEITIQQVAAQAGYHLTGAEAALISTMAGGLVHLVHQIYNTPGGLLAIFKRFTGLPGGNEPSKNEPK